MHHQMEYGLLSFIFNSRILIAQANTTLMQARSDWAMRYHTPYTKHVEPKTNEKLNDALRTKGLSVTRKISGGERLSKGKQWGWRRGRY